MKIGILAVQGAFKEHADTLDKLNISHFEIRQRKDLDTKMDGLILPGGESTVMKKLITDLQLFDKLFDLIQAGLPVFGTCAGLLLLANEISNDERTVFKTMHVTVKRNAFGRQLGSFKAFDLFEGKTIPMIFIRAPYIESVSPDVTILSTVNGLIVAARQNNQLATAFHPELTDDTTIHEYFITMCKNASLN
ncbi:MAG: pyridoxal 5'-phosphate synthase glutaminase subunit PdxT [Firmicutes bacterium]|nr:pyridoxal 5'-phosphate synthase glutaminase subunit PdxT [Bacillota bacterium]